MENHPFLINQGGKGKKGKHCRGEKLQTGMAYLFFGGEKGVGRERN